MYWQVWCVTRISGQMFQGYYSRQLWQCYLWSHALFVISGSACKCYGLQLITEFLMSLLVPVSAFFFSRGSWFIFIFDILRLEHIWTILRADNMSSLINLLDEVHLTQKKKKRWMLHSPFLAHLLPFNIKFYVRGDFWLQSM